MLAGMFVGMSFCVIFHQMLMQIFGAFPVEAAGSFLSVCGVTGTVFVLAVGLVGFWGIDTGDYMLFPCLQILE